jgi:hypothetical protein
VGTNPIERFAGTYDSDTAARQNAFLDGREGRVQSIHANLAVFHLDLYLGLFGRATPMSPKASGSRLRTSGCRAPASGGDEPDLQMRRK